MFVSRRLTPLLLNFDVMEKRFLYSSIAATSALLALVLVRIIILFVNTRLASFGDAFYLARQVTYTFNWFMMAEFFLYAYIEWRRINATGSKLTFPVMEWISLGAMFMCLVQAAVLFYYHLIYRDDLPTASDGLFALHNIVEIVAWLVMAIFLLCFFFYHRGHRIEYISKRNKRAKLLEEMVYNEANRATAQDEADGAGK